MSQTTAQIQDWIDRRLAGGDPPVDELIRLCEARVRELIRPRLNSFSSVRRDTQTTDILDETFLRLFRALDRRVPPTPRDLFQFIAHKIRQVLLDRWKPKKNRLRPEPILIDPVDWRSAGDGGIDGDTMEAFHEYVQRLPEGEKALFDLMYYHELPPAKAAACLDWPVSKVKLAWLNARRRVARRFGPASSPT
jgi:DNA-directed RNA polymerase specialized sigma24 family protein